MILLYFFFQRLSVPFFSSLNDWQPGVLVCKVFSCLYIQDINSQSKVWLAKTFSQSVGCSFILLIVSFAVQKLLNFMKVHLLIFRVNNWNYFLCYQSSNLIVFTYAYILKLSMFSSSSYSVKCFIKHSALQNTTESYIMKIVIDPVSSKKQHQIPVGYKYSI